MLFRLILSAFLWCGIICAVYGDAPLKSAESILLLDSNHTNDNWYDDVFDNLSEKLRNASPPHTVEVLRIYSELDSAPQSEYFFKLLQVELAQKKVKAIVSSCPHLTDILLSSKVLDNYSIPLITLHVPQQLAGKRADYPNMSGTVKYSNCVEMVKFATSIFPQHHKVVIAANAANLPQISKQLAAMYPQLDISFFSDSYFDADLMIKKIKELPNPPLIIFSRWHEDNVAERQKVINAFTPQSSTMAAPIFAEDNADFQPGFTGGSYGCPNAVAQQLFEQINDWQKSSGNISPAYSLETPEWFVNWALAKQLNGQLSNLPKNIRIINPPPELTVNKNILIIAIGVLSGLLAIIFYLWHLQRRSCLLAAVFNALPLRIMLADNKKRIILINHAMKQIDEFDQEISPKNLSQLPLAVQQVLAQFDKLDNSDCRPQKVQFELNGKIRQSIKIRLPEHFCGIDCSLWYSEDISDLQQAISQGQDALEQLKITLEALGESVIAIDTTGIITLCNPQVAKLSGLSTEQLLGKNINTVLPIYFNNSNEQRLAAAIQALQEKRRIEINGDAIFKTPDNQKVYLHIVAEPIYNHAEQVVGAVTVMRDITNEVLMKEKLQQQNQMVRSAAKLAQMGFFSFIDQKFDLSNVDAGLWPRTQDNQPLPWEKWICKNDVVELNQKWQQVADGRENGFTLRYTSDYSGLTQHYQIQVFTIHAENGKRNVYGVLQNVSKFIEAENRYLNTNMLLELIMNTLPCAIFVKDFTDNDRYLMGNNYFRNLINMNDSVIVGKRDSDIFSAALAEKYLQDDIATAEQGGVREIFETVLTAGNQIVEMKTLKTRLHTPDGKTLLLGMGMDITREKKLELEIQQNLALLNNLLDNSPAAIYAKDPQNNFRYTIWNKYMEEITGIKAKQIIGRTDAELNCFGDAFNQITANDLCAYHSNKTQENHINFINYCNERVFLYTLTDLITVSGQQKWLLTIALDETSAQKIEDERNLLLAEIKNYAECEHIVNGCLATLVSGNDSAATMRAILGATAQPCGADYCSFMCLDYTTHYLRIESVWSGDGIPLVVPGSRHPFDENSLLFKDLAAHNVVHINDTQHDKYRTDASWRVYQHRGIKSILYTAVFLNDQLCGVICLGFTKQRNFSELDERIINGTAHVIELALERRQKNELLLAGERQQALILNNINIPILLYDLQHELVFANRAACEWRDLNTNTLPLKANYPMADANESEYIDKVIKNIKEFNIEFTDQARQRTLSASFMPITTANGMIANVLECVIDTTAQNEARRQISLAKDAAEEAARAKGSFLATMSHEIRTPLNAIIGLTELLEEEHLPGDAGEHIKSVNAAGKSLLAIINDVLELSKIEADKVNLRYDWCNIKEILQTGARVLRQMARQKNLTFTLNLPEELPEIYFCDNRLRQLLLNIAGNAVKYTEHGGITVDVMLENIYENKADFIIKITDTGIGISAEEQERLFKPFEQASGGLRNSLNSTGLGLAISKNLVEKLGGELLLNSEIGRGSCFTMYFKDVKIRISECNTVTDTTQSQPVKIDGSVWVVDDVEINCKVLLRMLKHLNITAEYMTSPQIVLDRLNHGERPKLILSDLWMPQINGDVLAKTIRKISGLENVPIIAVTADSEAQNSFAMQDFSGVLLKPITLNKLKVILTHCKI